MTDEATPLDLIALDEPGYEVWASQKTSEIAGHRVPNLLLVVCEEVPELVLTIIDPQTKEEVFSAEDYLEIIDYLSENEYELVEGQMQICLDDSENDEDN